MVSKNSLARVALLLGPTASGKSSLALELAAKLNAQIISADSRQIYRELTIGTAKPSIEDQAKIKHHLIDCASIEDSFDASQFYQKARLTIQKIRENNQNVLVVGGTGFYLQTLTEGLFEIAKIDSQIKQKLAQELKQKGIGFLYEKLQKVDPTAAKKINPNDQFRILRALEVFFQTKKPLSLWHQEHQHQKQNQKPWAHFLKIGLCLDREKLYQKINQRVLQMYQAGLKKEALELKKTYPKNQVLSQVIGYQEWYEGLDLADEKIIAEIKKNTRRYAKRQLTWFRRDSEIIWFNPDQKEEIKNRLHKFYQSA